VLLNYDKICFDVLVPERKESICMESVTICNKMQTEKEHWCIDISNEYVINKMTGHLKHERKQLSYRKSFNVVTVNLIISNLNIILLGIIPLDNLITFRQSNLFSSFRLATTQTNLFWIYWNTTTKLKEIALTQTYCLQTYSNKINSLLRGLTLYLRHNWVFTDA
jgi:hypothetical protein